MSAIISGESRDSSDLSWSKCASKSSVLLLYITISIFNASGYGDIFRIAHRKFNIYELCH